MVLDGGCEGDIDVWGRGSLRLGQWRRRRQVVGCWFVVALCLSGCELLRLLSRDVAAYQLYGRTYGCVVCDNDITVVSAIHCLFYSAGRHHFIGRRRRCKTKTLIMATLFSEAKLVLDKNVWESRIHNPPQCRDDSCKRFRVILQQ